MFSIIFAHAAERFVERTLRTVPIVVANEVAKEVSLIDRLETLAENTKDLTLGDLLKKGK